MVTLWILHKAIYSPSKELLYIFHINGIVNVKFQRIRINIKHDAFILSNRAYGFYRLYSNQNQHLMQFAAIWVYSSHNVKYYSLSV